VHQAVQAVQAVRVHPVATRTVQMIQVRQTVHPVRANIKAIDKAIHRATC
jgi:hypothetical protein